MPGGTNLQHPLISMPALKAIVNVPHSSPIIDRDEVLKKGSTFGEETLGRGRWLLIMESFKQFMRGPSSRLLLVDGYCGDLCDSKVSPLSVLCATLAATLDQSDSSKVLHFFCGQHCRRRDTLSGPQGLLRSLIYQIIVYPDLFGPETKWESDVPQEQLAAEDLTGLCAIFSQMIRSIDRQFTVYCILDGISEFETSLYGWLNQLKQVFQLLHGIIANVAENQTGPRFKLFMTSAEKSTRISRMVKKGDHIALRAGNVSSPGKAQKALGRFAADSHR